MPLPDFLRTFLEGWLTNRPDQEELVKKGILKCDDTPVAAGLVFGRLLPDVPKAENGVPFIIIHTTEWLERNNAFVEEGLFRVPGVGDDIKAIKKAYDTGENVEFESRYDCHTIAGVLKLFLRELPEPLFIFDFYPTLIECTKQEDDDDVLVENLKALFEQLPQEHRDLAVYLLKFLKRVSVYAATSKMTVDNIAMVFAPNVLRPRQETLTQIMEDANHIKRLLRVMIDKAEALEETC